MIEYCHDKLVQVKEPLANRAGYALLECFLLHFRNLIEFFGKTPWGDDLSISRPADWSQRKTNSEDQRRKLEEDGQKLWKEYEWREKDDPHKDTISRYLQHLTKERTKPKAWEVEEMFAKISPLIEGFRNLCGDRTHVATDDPGFVVTSEGAHTATIHTFGFKGENR